MSTVHKLTITPKGDRELVLSRSFNAPKQLVYNAMTQPELLRRWLLGPPDWTFSVCEIDLRVGGRYRWAWTHPNGDEFGMSGEYRELSPPDRIVNTELYDGQPPGDETVGTAVLTESMGVTTLTTTLLFATPALREMMVSQGMEAGLSASYDRMDAVFAG